MSAISPGQGQKEDPRSRVDAHKNLSKVEGAVKRTLKNFRLERCPARFGDRRLDVDATLHSLQGRRLGCGAICSNGDGEFAPPTLGCRNPSPLYPAGVVVLYIPVPAPFSTVSMSRTHLLQCVLPGLVLLSSRRARRDSLFMIMSLSNDTGIRMIMARLTGSSNFKLVSSKHTVQMEGEIITSCARHQHYQ